jgi:hypothetical protein
MGMFIKVFSTEKQCDTLINLDLVVEIAPLKDGTVNLFFPDSGAAGGKIVYNVRNAWPLFEQFAIMPVSSDDVAKRVASLKGAAAKVA